MNGSMKGAVLPGNSTVALKEYPIPKPGHGQVLVRTLFSDRAGWESLLREIWNKALKLARKEHQKSRPTTWENLCNHWLDLLPSAGLNEASKP